VTEVRDQKSDLGEQGVMQMADSEWRMATSDSIQKSKISQDATLRALLPPKVLVRADRVIK
jgi:hypothetical protein